MSALDTSVALVTGASGALADALARGLLAAGATVYVADPDLDAAARLAVALGPRAHALRLRTHEALDWRFVRAAIVAERGRLDVVVRCELLEAGRTHVAHATRHLGPA
jgi:NAD(P)-dependent dehydrogenase (short-subunit alcohol dehydrogenase family)